MADFADEPRKISALPIDTQEKELAELHEVISILADRLTPVLSPEREIPTSVEADRETMKAEAPVSPVVQALRSNNGSISRASARLRKILNNLEV